MEVEVEVEVEIHTFARIVRILFKSNLIVT